MNARSLPVRAVAAAAAAVAAVAGGAVAADGERIEVTGEMIDTWCYFSGVMGGPDAVVGTAHHTCALWCAAGGIPVGLLADDGTVYMVMTWQGERRVVGADSVLEVQSHRLSASGTHYRRDGIDYLFVAEVVADEGITRRTHEEYGVVPPFAIPEEE